MGLSLPASGEPISLAPVTELFRTLPGWESELPTHLPAEEAIARLAEGIVGRHLPVWSAFDRDEADSRVAVGTLEPSFTAALLAALVRALLGSQRQREAALEQLRSMERLLRNERLVNWTAIGIAQRRQIETHWLSRADQMFQIGMGRKGRHFRQLTNQADSATGAIIAHGKHSTVEVLRLLGVPTTRSLLVHGPADAADAMRRIGVPCVVKPLFLGKGKGITTAIARESDLQDAIRHAIAVSSPPVLVENHVEGIDHRIMVAEGEMLWAYSKVAASVIGDGQSTVRMLVERENARRKTAKQGQLVLLEPIRLDRVLAAFLQRRYGLGLDDVLPRKARIELAGQSNISLGGILTDVTRAVHPDNRELAIRVAESLRLRIVGVDFLTPDISRSWKELDCAVIEVNITPGISGDGDGALVVRTQFPNRHSGQIPVFAAIGDEAFRAKASARLMEAAARAGVAARLVEWQADGLPPIAGTERPPKLTEAILDPRLDALVLCCDPAEIEDRGFPMLRADWVIAEDPAAFPFIEPLADEIGPLPKDGKAVFDKVRAIVASYADGADEPLPLLTLRPRSKRPFAIECLRFHAVPCERFHHALGLPEPTRVGMIDFADVFSAMTTLANIRLERAGAPPFPSAEFSAPSAGWHIVEVTATLAAPEGAPKKAEQALKAAIEAINSALARGSGRR